MAYEESNGHVIEYVTNLRDPERSNSWPPIHLEPTISKAAGDRGSVPNCHQ